MTSKEYLIESARSDTPDATPLPADVLHAAMGLCTEAGELMDNLKKAMFYGRDIDVLNLKEELGDMFWYAAILCRRHDWTFEDIMAANIAKLRVRYPEQFTTHDATHRDLPAEQVALTPPTPHVRTDDLSAA